MLADYNHIDEVIYVAPFSAISNLGKEKEKWAPKARIRFIAYETMSESGKAYLGLYNEVKETTVKRMIVADESVFIKNDLSIRFGRLQSIRKCCEYALILNGTPITKNEWDIYNQMLFLSPEIFGMTKEEFQNTFFSHIVYKKMGHHQHDFWKFSEVNAEALKKMIAPYVFRCDLALEIPEESETRMVPCQMDSYQEAKQNYLSGYLKDGESSTIINMLCYLNHLSAMAEEKCQEVAFCAKGKQVIVFYMFRDEGAKIKELLKGECCLIDGSCGKQERADIIASFRKSTIPLLLSFGCGSYSLNLQFANEIIYSSLTFDYSKFEQSMYRIKRIGQERPIKYTYILNDCGINRMILLNLERKRNLDDLVKEKLEKGDTQWLKDI